ncbi:MAG: helix-turn-helix domain-containing protein [Acidimicrobiia bacterium]|nr:helix-turn-helix domain-containing protein [Acidimicrobiia bacterium]
MSLREAQHQFGVPATTLAGWARSGAVDAVKQDGRWMVTPGSVAARLSARHGGTPRTASNSATRSRDSRSAADAGTMLVPRDAWDKLMDQLGNLHEAGQMMAEARERAAKAETEVVVLRERLSDLRSERDQLRSSLEGPTPAGAPAPGLWSRLRTAFGGADPRQPAP